MSWFTESNRWKHFLYAIPIGMFIPGFCVLGLAFGMEFKDKQHGGKFDWVDLFATLLGGLLGTCITAAIVCCIIFL